MSFQRFNFHPSITKAITLNNYTTPTPIQDKCIPEIISGKDVIAVAQTGTGKTAAFVLPILNKLATHGGGKKPQFLILSPTRELANQITQAIISFGKFTQVKLANLVGGMSYYGQNKDLARGANVIVATPGRLLDHLQSGRLDLSNIEILVLDEADRMLDMGFLEDVQEIVRKTPKTRQTLLLSATIDKQLMKIVHSFLRNPIHIDLSGNKSAAPQITQEIYRTNNVTDKSRLLKHFLNDANIYKAIIFSATKVNADKLAQQLCYEGYSAAALHGDLKQNVRNRTIEKMRHGKIQFLVATDVAARGIDISDITHVINYDLPKFCEDYVHRIGRTGRAGKTGVAISFMLPSDARNLQRIERYVGARFKIIHNLPLKAEHTALKKPENMPEIREEKRFAPGPRKPFKKQGNGSYAKKSPASNGQRQNGQKPDQEQTYRGQKRKNAPHFAKSKRAHATRGSFAKI